MTNIISAVALAYLSGSGMTTNAALIGRGLFRSVRSAVAGDFRGAAVEALASLATPALMSYSAMASLVLDALDAARELGAPALEALGGSLSDRYAA